MITTNTGAKKIEGTDNWREIFDAHNDSVNAHDKVSEAMTYVVNGNKSIESVSIPVGHYFRLANSSIAGRSDGLYTAKIAIPVDTVIDATYFNEAAPITGGIAEALNSKLTTETQTFSQSSGITVSDLLFKKNGKMVFLAGTFTSSTGSSSWLSIGTIPTGLKPSQRIRFTGFDNTNNYPCIVQINTNGTVEALPLLSATMKIVQFSITYILD